MTKILRRNYKLAWPISNLTCCRRSSVFRFRKTLLLLHFDAFLSWLVVKTGSGVQILTPTHSFLMLFSVFVTYQLQVGRVLTCKQKNLIGELKLETPKTKYFSPFSFIQSAARRFENKNKIIRRFKNFFVFFFCLVRCRYCRLKKNIDFTVAPSIILMS
jgi:hypothetical protein